MDLLDEGREFQRVAEDLPPLRERVALVLGSCVSTSEVDPCREAPGLLGAIVGGLARAGCEPARRELEITLRFGALDELRAPCVALDARRCGVRLGDDGRRRGVYLESGLENPEAFRSACRNVTFAPGVNQ